jgi:hypothetical protein
MHDKGFDYSGPGKAINSPRWWIHRNAAPSHREKATATADVMCKTRADLTALWYSAEKTLESERVESDPAFFRALASAKAENVRKAREVMRTQP